MANRQGGGKEAYLAFDLGAESGRAMLAVLEGERLDLAEVHRFLNVPQRLPSGLHWNLLDLWANLIEGLRKAHRAAGERGAALVSLGVDTWGVDFGLVGKSGQLLGLPFAYRDERNPPAMKRVLRTLGEKTVYDATGIQLMPFNTLFQLEAQHRAEPALLAQARHLLMMPDLLHYFFSGKAVNEATIVSTGQFIDPHKPAGTGRWAKPLFEALGIPTGALGKIVPAGTPLGALRPEVAAAAGIPEGAPIQVIVPGSHDTASAVAAVPADTAGPPWAFLSSGTWSIIGAELDTPLITDAGRKASFANERGVEGRIRYLKNIAGLWLVQECRRDFARRGQEHTYQQLTDLAAAAEPFRTLLDPGHAPFASPGDMPAKIAAFARSTGQPAPESPAQLVRACLESLAFAYRAALENLEALLGHRIEVLHIVGGGGQNTLLNQMAADALGRRVIVGPYEATAVGNALTQAIGRGRVKDLNHLRAIVRGSFQPMAYEPRDAEAFTRQRERFTRLLGK